MAKVIDYVLLGRPRRSRVPLPAGVTVCKATELVQLVGEGSPKYIFISFTKSSSDDLLKAGFGRKKLSRFKFKQLLTIESPRAASVAPLHGMFETVVGFGDRYSWLPPDELIAVVAGPDAPARFIGGAVDPDTGVLALVKGTRETVVVPFSFFEAAGDGVAPDFDRLGFTDYGHTVLLGEYEAATDGILYEIDPEYRRRLHQERRESERTFGASLRRLRLQRRLKRADFAPLAPKTLGRIERGEVARPHGKTLDAIARRLGVPADEIESF